MKKLLSLLGSITMIATPGATVIACGESSSTTTNLDQEAITKADYSIAAKNLSGTSSLVALDDDVLAETFKHHLIGYINPILKKLINRNVSGLEDQYFIEGFNLEQIKKAIEEVLENGGKTIPITGVTIRAKNAATDIKGKTTLGNVNIVLGRSITEIYNGENSEINIPVADLDPTESEIISYFNKNAKEDILKEVKEIRSGHLSFNKVQKRNRVTILGQGYFYEQIEAKFDSAKATNIQEIIKQQNLGKIDFEGDKPSDEQILATINEKNDGPDLTLEDLLISNVSANGANVEGVRLYKGSVDLSWERSTPEVSYKALEEKIEEAKNAIKNNKNPNADAEQTLEDRIIEAEEMVAAKDSTQEEIDQAVSLLEDAIETFRQETSTNYSGLQEAIKRAQEALEVNKNYNPEAIETLKKAITEAQSIMDKADSSQVEVDEASAKLIKEIEEFKKSNALFDLNESIKTARSVINSHPEKVGQAKENLEAEIALAEAVASNAESSTENMIQARISLENAVEVFLHSTTNLEVLQAKINEANQAIANNKNPNSEAEGKLKVVIEEARNLTNKADATQEEIIQITTKLDEAIEVFLLETATDFTKLVAKVNEAKQAISDNKNPNPEAQATLEQVISSAESILNNKDATQAEVDSAISLLEKSIQQFKESTKTKFDKLQEKISQADKALKANTHGNAIAIERLNQAISKANEILSNENATQSEVDAGEQNLDKAIKEFGTLTQIDFTSLDAKISEAKAKIETGQKTEQANTFLQSKIANAEKLLVDENTKQEAIAPAVQELDNWIKKFDSLLSLIPTLDQLQRAVDELMAKSSNGVIDLGTWKKGIDRDTVGWQIGSRIVQLINKLEGQHFNYTGVTIWARPSNAECENGVKDWTSPKTKIGLYYGSGDAKRLIVQIQYSLSIV